MKSFASTVGVFSSDTVILDMLNTLRLTIVFTPILIPNYETFPTFHQCFYVAVYFPPDPPALLPLYLKPSVPFGLV